MKIRINVKEDHIINGVCWDTKRCAISEAVRDVFPDAETHSCIIVIGDKGCRLPSFVTANIVEFDRCGTLYHIAHGRDRLKYVQPFSFEIEIPDEDLIEILPDSTIEQAREIINNSLNMEVV